MFLFWVKEDQVIWVGLIISLMVHGLIFTFSGTTFIQHPQYSVQASAQMVEVSIEEIKSSSITPNSPVSWSPNTSVIARKAVTKQSLKTGSVSRFQSGVKVKIKANPNYFRNPSPVYPELARQMRQEGFVMVSVDVDRAGVAQKVEIIQSSGFRLLDQAALKAVRHWKFQPGSIGNIPVDSTVTVPIRFRLEK